MILKIIVLFLIFMAVLGMIGKILPGSKPNTKRRCRKCGGHVIGGSCPCGATKA
ncbi:hypothetical protein [Roseobacter sp. HKCCA0434]|uniref:hypothetical protein n=1 Tax=Roseobacter sp. HKCCA0434 TaxID=3079297 RepID=UPI002905B3F3|nr:hypothetical protein [Roseobacter sp. HKCCA0434]